MNQALRWKRFIEWWEKYTPKVGASVGMVLLEIDEKIDELKNKKENNND